MAKSDLGEISDNVNRDRPNPYRAPSRPLSDRHTEPMKAPA